jgi:hypothetical protein
MMNLRQRWLPRTELTRWSALSILREVLVPRCSGCEQDICRRRGLATIVEQDGLGPGSAGSPQRGAEAILFVERGSIPWVKLEGLRRKGFDVKEFDLPKVGE